VKRLPALLAVAAAVGATACSTGPRTPDEFRVVRKAPLTVPPDFNLRPPSPGASRPQDLQPDVQARVAVFGTDLGQTATEGEKLFVRALGGEATDRTVRAAVDFDSAQIVRKNRSFADAILSFGRPVATAEPVVDAAAEAERLRSEQEALAEVTGGGQVMIRRRASGKLPGL
jgi:hypothetical protein